jgi:ribosomal protein S18 acetylase RimI-like enzyme
MATILNYTDAHFQHVLHVLKQSHQYDRFNESLLQEKLYLDPEWNPDLTWIAMENNKVVGFLQGVTRLISNVKYGYIKLIGVVPEMHRQGIGRQLFKTLENRLMEKQISNFRIYDVPLNYFMPGIDPRYTPAVCFAQKMGFSHTGEAVNMQVDLLQSDWNVSAQIENLKTKHIEISRAGELDKVALFEFISEEWALWQNELAMAYLSNPISIFIAKLNGKIKAFSAYNGNNVGTGWFGPMGTHRDLRGKGMGNILLYLCLADMRQQGFKYSTIPWVAPIGFYSHYANASIDRVFWRFEKKIKYA